MKKRMFTPDFFSDEELVETLSIAGRLFYLGTWSVAEDSGVLLLSPLSLKMKLFPGDDISSNDITDYIEQLIDLGKIIPFESGGKKYGWLRNFQRHQTLDNPAKPVLPLPEWVTFTDSDKRRQRTYEVDENALEQYISTLQTGRVRDVSGTCPVEKKGIKRKELKEAAALRSLSDYKAQEEQKPLPPLENESDVSLDTYCQEVEAQMVACSANHNYQAKGESFKWIQRFHKARVPISFIRAGIVQAYAQKPDISTFAYCAKKISDLWQRELAKQEPVSDLKMVINETRGSPQSASTGRYIPDTMPESARRAMLEDEERARLNTS